MVNDKAIIDQKEKVFSRSEVEERIFRLCRFLGIELPRLDSIPKIKKPAQNGSVEICVSINPDLVVPGNRKPSYNEILRWVIEEFSKKNILRNSLGDRIVKFTRITASTHQKLKKCTCVGPFIVFPAYTGKKWSSSAIRTRNHLETISHGSHSDFVEFPLDSVSCICLYRTREKNSENSMPVCAGDTFRGGRSRSLNLFTPILKKDDEGEIALSVFRDENKCEDNHSIWTGFVPK